MKTRFTKYIPDSSFIEDVLPFDACEYLEKIFGNVFISRQIDPGQVLVISKDFEEFYLITNVRE